ncbi:unnamed protein product [Linum trigynum]|uniref:Reverse transcriptase domain-containing protein n=1 Tax=Linum trigynum TaxID=586398 RepID=A0AAV2G962_9ROSI
MTEAAWQKGSDLLTRIAAFAKDARHWNQHTFGNIHQRKEKLLQGIERLEQRMNGDAENWRLTKLRAELEEVLLQEEILWCHKSNMEWNTSGDRNTKYFHARVMRRRRRNQISSLRNSNEEWTDDPDELKGTTRDFYVALYTDDGVAMITILHGFPTLPTTDWKNLDKNFSIDVLHEAIRAMGPFKAPGVDGLNPLFYQRFWSLVGPDVLNFAASCWSDPSKIHILNQATLVLIPKVMSPSLIQHFRPISICNVGYKLITKCLAYRIKPLMPKLVHETQTSFVPGRHITDNVCILQEVVHSMRAKMGRTGWMIFKIDLAKAYDRIRWSFVRDTLQAARAPISFVDLAMECITTSRMRIQWNGGLTDEFTPTRVLRQGCPLSPYLFTLCMERLGHLIHEAVTHDQWQPIQQSQSGPDLSHIFFADDIILFGVASIAQVSVINKTVEDFGAASGQQISKPKSRVSFPKMLPLPWWPRSAPVWTSPRPKILGAT